MDLPQPVALNAPAMMDWRFLPLLSTQFQFVKLPRTAACAELAATEVKKPANLFSCSLNPPAYHILLECSSNASHM